MSSGVFNDGSKDTEKINKKNLKNNGEKSSIKLKLHSKSRQNPNVPDTSYGDLYCKICDSHMNAQQMWSAHIAGKKHIKNVKKGHLCPKYKILKTDSSLNDYLPGVHDAVIGLQYISEEKRRDKGVPSIFNCFLCHASLPTAPLTIDHVRSFKHRSNCLKLHDEENFKILEDTDLKKSAMESLVADMAAEFESKHGRGEVQVKIEIEKNAVTKRSYSSDSDSDVNGFKKYKRKIAETLPRRKHQLKSSVLPRSSACSSSKSRDYESPRNYLKSRTPDNYKYDRYASQSGRLSDEERSVAHQRYDYKSNEMSYVERNQSPQSYDYDGKYEPYTSPLDPYEEKKYFLSSFEKDYMRNKPEEPAPSDFYVEKSNHDMYERRIVYGPSPPKELCRQPSLRLEQQMFEDFLKQASELPAIPFFNLCLYKLKKLELNDVNELTALYKLAREAQEMYCRTAKKFTSVKITCNWLNGVAGANSASTSRIQKNTRR